MRRKYFSGYSLMEVMVAIGVFALLAVFVTQALVVSLKSVKKSDAQNRVRANLDYAVSVIDRQLRNANSIDCCNDPGTCPNQITYTDIRNKSTYFNCVFLSEGDGYVASGSARLTSTDVNITACSISCVQTSGVPDSAEISLSGKDAKTSGGETARVTVEARVMLRDY